MMSALHHQTGTFNAALFVALFCSALLMFISGRAKSGNLFMFGFFLFLGGVTVAYFAYVGHRG